METVDESISDKLTPQLTTSIKLEEEKLAQEGSYASRKFVMAIIGLVLITTLSVMGIWIKGVLAILPTFVGGVIGIVSVYLTGNVMNKFVSNKTSFDYSPKTTGTKSSDPPGMGPKGLV